MGPKKTPGKHDDINILEDYQKKNLLENIITKHEKTQELQKIQHSTDTSKTSSIVSVNINFRNEHPYSMNEQTLRARNAVANRGRYITQLYLGVTVSIGALCYGIVLGWTTPALRLAMESESISGLDTYANIASLIPLGCCIGGIFFNFLCQQKGPKKTMLTIAPLQMIVWVLLMFSKNLTVSCALLFLSSFFSVGFILCGEVLLQDSVHSLNLQHLYLMFISSIYVGITLTYVCGLMAHKLKYNYVSVILVALMMFFLFFCHESPVFLYEKHPVKAQKSLRFYRGEGNIYEDLRQIKKDADARTIDMSAKYLLLKKAVYRAVLIVLALNFFQAFSGYFAFIAYGLYIFHTSNKSITDVDVFGKIPDALIMGLTYYFLVLVSVYTHFKVPYGVKKPMIISTFLVTLMLSIISAYLYCYERNVDFLLGNNWIRLVLQGLYIQAYQCGLGLYPDVIMMDYVPQQIYPWLKTVAFSFRWFWVYLMVRFTLVTQAQISGAGAVCILAIASFIGFLFCCQFVIECRGKTLLQIQLKLGGNPVGYRSQMRTRTQGVTGHS